MSENKVLSATELNATIAKLTYMTHGVVGRDWRSGRQFVSYDKGNEFEALETALEVLRHARVVHSITAEIIPFPRWWIERLYTALSGINTAAISGPVGDLIFTLCHQLGEKLAASPITTGHGSGGSDG